jgi:hypothetical protein
LHLYLYLVLHLPPHDATRWQSRGLRMPPEPCESIAALLEGSGSFSARARGRPLTPRVRVASSRGGELETRFRFDTLYHVRFDVRWMYRSTWGIHVFTFEHALELPPRWRCIDSSVSSRCRRHRVSADRVLRSLKSEIIALTRYQYSSAHKENFVRPLSKPETDTILFGVWSLPRSRPSRHGSVPRQFACAGEECVSSRMCNNPTAGIAASPARR